MSDEANNVAVLTEAYRRWHDSRGGSVDHWMSICDENIAFGSLIQGAAPEVAYMTEYNARDELGRYFEGLARDWEMIEYKVDQFVAQDDRVVMLGHCAWRNKHTGKVVNDAEGGFLALREWEGGRVLRVFRHRAGACRGRLRRRAEGMRP